MRLFIEQVPELCLFLGPQSCACSQKARKLKQMFCMLYHPSLLSLTLLVTVKGSVQTASAGSLPESSPLQSHAEKGMPPTR